MMTSETNKRGYWHNPNARWNWYTIGGRWSGYLRLLEGKIGRYGNDSPPRERKDFANDHCDSALVMDCDFSPDKETYRKSLRFWDVVVEGKSCAEEEKDIFIRAVPYIYHNWAWQPAVIRMSSRSCITGMIKKTSDNYRRALRGDLVRFARLWGNDNDMKLTEAQYERKRNYRLAVAVMKALPV